MLAGDLVIGVKAGLNLSAVGVDIKGHYIVLYNYLGSAVCRIVKRFGNFFAACAGGVAGIDALQDSPILNANHAADNGKRTKAAVFGIRADALAVGGAVQLFEHGKILCLFV